MNIIEVKKVGKIYPLGKTQVEALKNVSFSLTKGDFVSIAGPSGSGKSTILNIIGLIDTPTAGEVLIDGESVYGAQDFAALSKSEKKHKPLPKGIDKKITRLRRHHIGFIFQSFNLLPVLNVYENIEFPLLMGGAKDSASARKEWISYLVEQVGLKDWIHHKPNELSGGQRQRVAIARALAAKPVIVLADEPTANLDSKTGDAILQLMKAVNKEIGTTFIFSTHDSKIVALADHSIKLLDGEIIEDMRQEV